MARRTVLLTSALVVAALGTLLVFLYVRGVDDRAVSSTDAVQVLFAASDINVGTSVQEAVTNGLFTTQTYPEDAVPDGAVSTPNALGDTVAGSLIRQNEIILAGTWVDPAQAGSGNSGDVPQGLLGVSINLSDSNRVATFLEVGSKVAVFSTSAEGASPLFPETVEVIGLGSSGSSDAGDLPPTLVTLAVTQPQAEALFVAQSQGEVFLALLGEGATIASAAASTIPLADGAE